MTTFYICLFFAAVAALWRAIVEVQKSQDARDDREAMKRACKLNSEPHGMPLSRPDL